ncbi:MAG: hypothetical protein J6T10_26650 [Methanobrevibacter sp.]|nr:hypothetical protein [Methanobrevibacter sp.]
MSYCEYFKAAIRNFYNTKKLTQKVKSEAKLLIKQFEISEAYDEFENEDEYKNLKIEINKIRELIF